jgi:SAM-dependent methyltransferase
MSFRARVVAQFKRPTGWPGALVGRIMARRPSNRLRNSWTIDQLDIRPTDRVLEIGFGPGLALAWAAEKATAGRVVGLDHSPVMRAQAAKRNRDAIAAGRMELHEGGLEALARIPGSFDRIFSANVVQFWDDPEAAFRLLKDRLAPGGRIATTFMPRNPGAGRAEAMAMAERLEGWMKAAGFKAPRRAMLDLEPAPAVCVLGEAPL